MESTIPAKGLLSYGAEGEYQKSSLRIAGNLTGDILANDI